MSCLVEWCRCLVSACMMCVCERWNASSSQQPNIIFYSFCFSSRRYYYYLIYQYQQLSNPYDVCTLSSSRRRRRYIHPPFSSPSLLSLFQEIISPGDGTTFPKPGDKLTMHYQWVTTNTSPWKRNRCSSYLLCLSLCSHTHIHLLFASPSRSFLMDDITRILIYN